jgi:uncharacterized protein (TIGR00369 family)
VSIWQHPPDLEAINLVSKDTLSEQLGIEFLEAGDDYLKARMPVDERTHQPMGLLHGGASAALAETLGSVAGLFAIDPSRQYVVGLALNANHLRPVRQGWVIGLARPHHLGRTTQVWGIEIREEEDRLVSIVQLTLAVRPYAEGQEPTIPAAFFKSGKSK